MMGAPADDQEVADAKPAHKVTLSDFYISEYEVSQHVWVAVMGDNPSTYVSTEPSNRFIEVPVMDVSWEDCQVFIKRLNELTGCHFRLPTEAEWEFAARGGNKSRGYRYSGSNDYSSIAAQRNEESPRLIGPAMSRRSNELGIYDMTGNVEEWCQDWYGPYGKAALVNPKGPSSGAERVLRGGSFYLGDPRMRVWDRSHASAESRSPRIGLRLVCDVSGLKIRVSELTLDRQSLQLEIGEEASLKVHAYPEYADKPSVTWSSSDESVVKVISPGKMRGIKNGLATITVSTPNHVEAKCEVTVFSYIEPQQVDLGLSVKWGTFNLGASRQEECGRYFAWGETEEKEDYTSKTYRWYTGERADRGLTKYCSYSRDGYEGFKDDKITLDLKDDAAYILLDGKWRMPTKAEVDELMENCTWEWSSLNGVRGYTITSNIPGYTNRSIFIPAAGYMSEDNTYRAGTDGHYWCSELYNREYGSDFVYSLRFHEYLTTNGPEDRSRGLPIRPVTGKMPTSSSMPPGDKKASAGTP